MSSFTALIKFTDADGKGDRAYYSSLAESTSGAPVIPKQGAQVEAYTSIEDLKAQQNGKKITIGKLLAPLPSPSLPIYCVGLNYRSHAAEAKLKTPKRPPLWTKPAATLANPGEAVPVNAFCMSSLPDYEAELVFVTSRECKDVSVADAESYILGYTIGNDLSCRYFQLPDQTGGQFFYAKAFDKFAPIGPVLISADRYNATNQGRRLKLRVNGETRQDVEIAKDMIFSPAQILSSMSQGTTIPAGTAVMTGTPAGVGAFMSPKTFLRDGDEVEVEISHIGTLRNTIAAGP